ncbi:MAG TPA: GNAT family N-acetyltransferase, partial [Candidatus Aphodoplasma excrementigallinarum]|nr:GNAT family N-acetyltransferase [Candidatus Aphodoplasma excrementigallinarum]
MGLGFEVRAATYDDIDAIEQITHEAFQKYAQMVGNDKIQALSETKEDIKRDIDTKLVLVAFMDDVPVGSVRVEVDLENKTAYLSRFGVRVSSQNNGVGKSLMNLVDIKMREMGVKRIMLHTGAKVGPLVRFYYGR